MSVLRVLSVFGTPPEAIKMAPVVLELAREGFESLVCVTAQQRDRLAAVLDLFGIQPDHDLDLAAAEHDPFGMTAEVLLGLRDVIRAELPDRVLVHGETTSAFASALAAFYEGVPVAHVEAGLRTWSPRIPFPEEMNRTLVGRLADLHFAPTEVARANLVHEHVAPERIHVTGNTVVDALLFVLPRVRELRPEDFAAVLGARLLARITAGFERMVLVTGHRRESFGRGLRDLCQAIRTASVRHPDWLFVYPLHPNPSAKRPVERELGELANVVLTEPLDYATFVWLMNRSDLLLTDSGGIQEEAPALGKPVLVTRELTERPEAVEAGAVRLVGTDPARVLRSLEEVLLDPAIYEQMSSAHSLYGDGRASTRIAAVLADEAERLDAAPIRASA